MTSPCTRLKSDPEAYKLCRFLVHKKKIPTRKLDTGVPYIDFRQADPNKANSNPKLSIVAKTKGNKKLEVGEIYTHALKLLEKENTKSQTTSKTSLSYYLSSLKSFRLPWILNDFNSKTTWDKAIVTKINRQIKKTKKVLVRKGLKPNTYKFNKALVHKLVAFVVNPKNKGGLGIKPDTISSDNVEHERTALTALNSPKVKAHCTELNYILYPIFKMAGLKPSFLLVYRDQWDITEITHVCVGIRLDPSKPNAITPVDLTSTSKQNWIGTPHKKVIEIPMATTLGFYYNNKATALYRKNENLTTFPKRISQKIRASFLKALNLDKRNPILFYNLANYFRLVESNPVKVRHYVKGALLLYPKFKGALILQSLTNRTTSLSLR